MTPASLRNEDNASTPVLYMALELRNKTARPRLAPPPRADDPSYLLANGATESLNETVAALFSCERRWPRQRSTSPGTTQCFKSFHTAERTLEGIEAMNMIRKGQVKRLAGDDARGQAEFVTSLFGIAA